MGAGGGSGSMAESEAVAVGSAGGGGGAAGGTSGASQNRFTSALSMLLAHATLRCECALCPTQLCFSLRYAPPTKKMVLKNPFFEAD